MARVLEQEDNTYNAHLPQWVNEGAEGRFVVIKSDQVLGMYQTHDEALKAAYAAYGIVAFMVRRISAFPVVHMITRFALPQCHI